MLLDRDPLIFILLGGAKTQKIIFIVSILRRKKIEDFQQANEVFYNLKYASFNFIVDKILRLKAA
ncbi:hypothetical protein EG341_05540 [Chryseobacterium lactis]|nr:hypothetical protein EG341_05540 [Chryseobacterium lactis]